MTSCEGRGSRGLIRVRRKGSSLHRYASPFVHHRWQKSAIWRYESWEDGSQRLHRAGPLKGLVESLNGMFQHVLEYMKVLTKIDEVEMVVHCEMRWPGRRHPNANRLILQTPLKPLTSQHLRPIRSFATLELHETHKRQKVESDT